MDWKSPPMLLGGANSVALLGFFFWSYKKFGAIESRLDLIEDEHKVWYKKVGGEEEERREGKSVQDV